MLLLPLLCGFSFLSVASGLRIHYRNDCENTVWVAYGRTDGRGNIDGEEMDPGDFDYDDFNTDVDATLILYGRQECDFSRNGDGSCMTGDCIGGEYCDEVDASVQVTKAVFTFKTTSNPQFGISIQNGFNLPMSVSNKDCDGEVSCKADFSSTCSQPLVRDHNGQTLSCSVNQGLSPWYNQFCPQASNGNSGGGTVPVCSGSDALVVFCPDGTTDAPPFTPAPSADAPTPVPSPTPSTSATTTGASSSRSGRASGTLTATASLGSPRVTTISGSVSTFYQPSTAASGSAVSSSGAASPIEPGAAIGKNSGLSKGIIIGIVVGIVVGVLLLVAAIIYLYRRRKYSRVSIDPFISDAEKRPANNLISPISPAQDPKVQTTSAGHDNRLPTIIEKENLLEGSPASSADRAVPIQRHHTDPPQSRRVHSQEYINALDRARHHSTFSAPGAGETQPVADLETTLHQLLEDRRYEPDLLRLLARRMDASATGTPSPAADRDRTADLPPSYPYGID